MSDTSEKIKKETSQALFKCNFCGKILSSKSNLNLHQKTTNFCLKIQCKNAEVFYECKVCKKKFTVKDACVKHENNCTVNIILSKKELFKEYENFKINHEKIVKKYKNKIKKLNKDVKELENKYESRITELESRLENIALKASTKPTASTSTKNILVNNFQSISFDEIKQQSSQLTLEQFAKGADGYLEFGMPFFKNKILCVDLSRKTLKWKNEDGNIITDPEGETLVKKFCQSIEDRNKELFREYAKKLDELINKAEEEGRNNDVSSLFDYHTTIGIKALQVEDIAKGKKTELASEITKKLASEVYRMNMS